MEEIVYLSIRFGCTAYLLYKVWKQKERIGKICDLLYTPRNRPQAEKDNGEPGNAQDVMGATRFVYLDENAGKTVAPYMSQQLETGSDFIGADKDIPEDEVECKLPLEEMRMLKEEQEELDSRSPETEAIAPMVTPADLLNVGDVLLNLNGAGSDENKSYRAAMTLHSIRETDMFELFSSQVENKKLIEEAGRLNVPGRPIQYKTTPDFLRTFGLQSLEELPPIDKIAFGEPIELPEEESSQEAPAQPEKA